MLHHVVGREKRCVVTDLAQHLDSRFPEMSLIEAFSIFDPSAMEKQSAPQLLENLENLTAHYGPYDVIDSDATVCEYQCFQDLFHLLHN